MYTWKVLKIEEKPLVAQCRSGIEYKKTRIEATNTGYNTETYEDT